MWPFPDAAPSQDSFLTQPLRSQETVSGVDLETAELIHMRHHVGAVSRGKHNQALSVLAGSSISPFKGRGIDFEEVRRYQPGDEIRHMDWRVTARSGEPYLKLFREEREQPVFFLVDFSASMLFGTKVAFKSVMAARVGTLFAWASLKHGDQVGSVIFSDQDHVALRPQGGRAGVLCFIRALTDLHRRARNRQHADCSATCGSMVQALNRLTRIARPGSRLFLISDFRSFDDQAFSALIRLRTHHELIALMIFDPVEAIPPPPGCYRISNGTRSVTIDTSVASFVTDYRATFAQLRQHIETTGRRVGMGVLPISTEQSLSTVLQTGLRDLRPRSLSMR